MPNRDSKLENWIEVQSQISKLYAHDFKNPISALSANLSYIEAVMPGSDEDLKEAVTDSVQAVRQLLQMINNFLQVSKLEAGDKPELGAIGLKQLVDSSLKKCRELLSSSGTEVEVLGDIPDGFLEIEIPYVELALENLILISSQHSPPGTAVALQVGENDKAYTFTVTDSGKPVSEEYRQILFSREHQMKAKSISDSRYGRAMGLYAAGLAARTLGGDVKTVENPTGESFVLSLPKSE